MPYDEPELTDSQTEEASEMDDVTLLGIIEQLESESYGFASGDLANQRAYAIERYLCEPFGDEIEGRSQVVSTDLRDTIEWALPQVLRVFLSGDEIVEFEPMSPQDKTAKLETQYVNHVILEKNDAFNVFSTWFRDAMLSKIGYVKAYWETRQDVLKESYQGLTDGAYQMVANDPDVQITQEWAYPDPYYVQPPPPPPPMPGQPPAPMQPPPPPPMLHDVELRRLRTCGYVRTDNVPPEELLVHRSLRTIGMQDALFVQHATRKTLSELRQDGYQIDDYIAGSAGDEPDDEVSESRDRFGDEDESDNSRDPATRQVWVRESYVRVDYDGDGIAELRKVCHIGRTILANEETDMIPFAAVTPIIFPHKHIGLGMDDMCAQQLLVDTAIKRGYLDNLYLKNNGRYAIDVTRVNVDDMLTSRPGGIVRVQGNPGDAMFPFTHQDGGSTALEGIQMVQQWRTASTGVMLDQANMSPDVLQGSTATGIAQQVSAGQARIEAMTRCFAMGVKELVGIVHALTLQNATASEKLRINGEWQDIDPREWVKRTAMRITVGLGTGTKETRIMQLTQLAQMQQAGLQAGIVTPKNLYQTGTRITQEMGYRNDDDFWTDPAKNPPPPPQPPEGVLVEQERQKGKQAELQATGQMEMQKFQATQQSDAQAAQQAAALKERELQMQAAAKQQEQQNALQVQATNDARDDQKAEREHQRELQRMAMEDARERDRMLLDAQLKREEMQMKAQTAEHTAVVKGNAAVASAKTATPAKSDDGELKGLVKELAKAHSTAKRAKRNPDGSWDVRPAT